MIDVKVEKGIVSIRHLEGRPMQIMSEAARVVKAVCDAVGSECGAESGEELLDAVVKVMVQERIEYYKLKEAKDSEVLS